MRRLTKIVCGWQSVIEADEVWVWPRKSDCGFRRVITADEQCVRLTISECSGRKLVGYLKTIAGDLVSSTACSPKRSWRCCLFVLESPLVYFGQAAGGGVPPKQGWVMACWVARPLAGTLLAGCRWCRSLYIRRTAGGNNEAWYYVKIFLYLCVKRR